MGRKKPLRLLLASITGLTLTAFFATPAAAIVSEIDKATEGLVYTDGNDPCLELYDGTNLLAWGCFVSNGDKWKLHDYDADGKSAAVQWENYYNDGLYRKGICYDPHGWGSDAYCNKDYHEESTLEFRVCTYDAPSGTIGRCTSWISTGAN